MLFALAGLRQRQLSAEQLSRVAVERDGALLIEAEAPGSQRWFRFDNATLEELQPRDDHKIPLLKHHFADNMRLGSSLLSYRPGRRAVLGTAGAQRPSVVKGYRRGKSEQAAICHEIAVAACGGKGFQVPVLLGHSAVDESLLMPRHRGSTPGISPESASLWSAIGACLRRFQSAGVAEGVQEFGALDELTVLDEQARRFLLCMPVLPENWQRGRDLLTEAAAKLPPAEPCLAHRDLHDGQFLIHGETVSLLDFDLLCKADAALDTGNLLAHMVLRGLQSGCEPGRTAVCGRALLSGLARHDEPGFKQRLLFYQATSFYRLALLYALRPRWAHLTGALTERGRQCIDRYIIEVE